MVEAPFFSKDKKSSKRGRNAEKRATKRLNDKASLVPASGAIPGLKGDISQDDFLIESKSTVNMSLGVKQAWLDKIAMEARDVNKFPALMLQFTDERGEVVFNGSWVCMPESVFKELSSKDEE